MPEPARLYVLMAREAPTAVILRRGPTRWTRLVLWHTSSDAFVPGQWIAGRVYERRCDLSPDGALLVYFLNAIAGRRAAPGYTHAWTAVSRPPYFTALALWPKGDAWHGGGLFTGPRTLLLNHWPVQAVPHPNHLPTGLEVRPNPMAHGEDGPLYLQRLRRDGWQHVRAGVLSRRDLGYGAAGPEEWQRASPDGRWLLVERLTPAAFGRPGGSLRPYYDVLENGGTERLSLNHATWAGWDQRGRLVEARAGALWMYELERTPPAARLLADFNDMQPEPLPPPGWAALWP